MCSRRYVESVCALSRRRSEVVTLQSPEEPDSSGRILDACPHASEVCTFHGWLAAGRVVMKGQKGIRLVAPDEIADGKIRSIKPIHVFDVTQTQERTQRAAA